MMKTLFSALIIGLLVLPCISSLNIMAVSEDIEYKKIEIINTTIINEDGSKTIVRDGKVIGYLPNENDDNVASINSDFDWNIYIQKLLIEQPFLKSYFSSFDENLSSYVKYRLLEEKFNNEIDLDQGSIHQFEMPQMSMNLSSIESYKTNNIIDETVVETESDLLINKSTNKFIENGIASGGTIGFSPGTFKGWDKQLFFDDFNDLNDDDMRHKWYPTTYVGGSGTMGIVTDGSYKTLQSNSPVGINNKAYTHTYSIPYCEDYDYYLSLNFRLKSSTNHWVDVINNGKVEIVIDYGTTLAYYNGASGISIASLNVGTWYKLELFIDKSSNNYKIFLDSTYKTAAPLLTSTETKYLRFGDFEVGNLEPYQNYGYIQYDNVQMKAQYDWYSNDASNNGVKFFDDFDNHLFYSWDNFGKNTDSLSINAEGNLEIDSTTYMQIRSRYIDYDSEQADYWIDTYYKPVEASNWFKVLYTSQVMVMQFYDNNLYLVYNSAGASVNVKALQLGTWYHIRVWIDCVNGGQDKIGGVYVNNMDVNLITPSYYPTYDNNEGNLQNPDRIIMGDLVESSVENGHGQWKYVYLEGKMIQLTDSDSDGLSNNFEIYNNILFYGDDAEDAWYAKGDLDQGLFLNSPMQRGAPTSVGSDPSRGNGGSTYLYGTNIDSYYGDYANGLYDTPHMDFTKTRVGSTLRLSFFHWFDTESPWDGGHVVIWQGVSQAVRLGGSSEYNCPIVYALGDMGFCGQSSSVPPSRSYASDWIETSMSIPSTYHAYTDVRIAFQFESDGTNHNYYGWYIDDIKIYASTEYSGSGDTDSDGKSDGVEFYHMGSSPFRVDTDLDGLTDDVEYPNDRYSDTSNTLWMFNYPFYRGNNLNWERADPSYKDVFIQFDYILLEQVPSSEIDSIKTLYSQHGIKIHYFFNNYLNPDLYTTEAEMLSYQSSLSVSPSKYYYFIGGVTGCYDASGSYVGWFNGNAGMIDTGYASIGYCTPKKAILHEIGHIAGLQHSGTLNTVMYGHCVIYNLPFNYNNNEWQDLNLGENTL